VAEEIGIRGAVFVHGPQYRAITDICIRQQLLPGNLEPPDTGGGQNLGRRRNRRRSA
jgi:hypothetical protein